MSLKMAFQGIGIRDLNDGGSLHGVENALELDAVDLLIWDSSCAGGDVCQFTHDIRHHRVGKTPFLSIITMVTDATPANIREVMESGRPVGQAHLHRLSFPPDNEHGRAEAVVRRDERLHRTRSA